MCSTLRPASPEAIKDEYGFGVEHYRGTSVFETEAKAYDHPYLPIVTGLEPGEVQLAEWGLIPRWVRDEQQAHKMQNSTIMARAETIDTLASYRNCVNQRCLILASCFYEWQHQGKDRLKHEVSMFGSEAMGIGGLWNLWKPPFGDPYLTFTLITTAANELMSEVHNSQQRMPFILTAENYARWIDPQTPWEEAKGLMQPLTEGLLKAKHLPKPPKETKRPKDEQGGLFG